MPFLSSFQLPVLISHSGSDSAYTSEESSSEDEVPFALYYQRYHQGAATTTTSRRTSCGSSHPSKSSLLHLFQRRPTKPSLDASQTGRSGEAEKGSAERRRQTVMGGGDDGGPPPTTTAVGTESGSHAPSRSGSFRFLSFPCLDAEGSPPRERKRKRKKRPWRAAMRSHRAEEEEAIEGRKGEDESGRKRIPAEESELGAASLLRSPPLNFARFTSHRSVSSNPAWHESRNEPDQRGKRTSHEETKKKEEEAKKEETAERRNEIKEEAAEITGDDSPQKNGGNRGTVKEEGGKIPSPAKEPLGLALFTATR